MGLKCPIQPFTIKTNIQAIIDLVNFMIKGAGPLILALAMALILDVLESGLNKITAITEAIAKAWLSVIDDLMNSPGNLVMCAMNITNILASRAKTHFIDINNQFDYIISQFNQIKGQLNLLGDSEYGDRDKIWAMVDKLLFNAITEYGKTLAVYTSGLSEPEYLLFYRKAKNFVESAKNILNDSRRPFKSVDIDMDEIISGSVDAYGRADGGEKGVKAFEEFANQYTKALEKTYIRPYADIAKNISDCVNKIIGVTTDINVQKLFNIDTWTDTEGPADIWEDIMSGGENTEDAIGNPPLITNFTSAAGYVTAINFWREIWFDTDARVSDTTTRKPDLDLKQSILDLRNKIKSAIVDHNGMKERQKLKNESDWLFEIIKILGKMSYTVEMMENEQISEMMLKNWENAFNRWTDLPDIDYLGIVAKISGAAITASTLDKNSIIEINKITSYLSSQRAIVSNYISVLSSFPQYRFEKLYTFLLDNPIVPEYVSELFLMGKIPNSALDSLTNFMGNIGIVSNIYEFLKPCFTEAQKTSNSIVDLSKFTEIANNVKAGMEKMRKALLEKIPIISIAEEIMTLKEQVTQSKQDAEDQVRLAQDMLFNAIGNVLSHTISIELDLPEAEEGDKSDVISTNSSQ